jgi:hypothetical protein
MFTSCTTLDRSVKITYNGEELSLSDITELRQDFPSEESVPSENEVKEEKQLTLTQYSELLTGAPVYWVEKGEVWHISLDCRHIKVGSKVIYGNEADALACGKTRLCLSCSKKIEALNK